MRIITEKELRYSSNLVAQGKLDEEERMVVSSQLNQAADLIEAFKMKPTGKEIPSDSDIEAWADKAATITSGKSKHGHIIKAALFIGAKAFRDGGIKHIK